MRGARPISDAQAAVTGLPRWRDLIRERFVALEIRSPADAPPLHGSIGPSRAVGPLDVTTVRSVDQVFRRTSGLISSYGEDVVQVGHVRRGTAWLEQDGRHCRLDPGRFAVYDTTRPFTWTMRGAWTLDVLTWPRGALSLDDRRARTVTARSLGAGPTGQVARAALEQLSSLDDDPGAAEGIVLAGRVGDLVLDATRSDAAAGDARDVRVDTVLDYVELHLRDPALCPAYVAVAFHLSLRSLQRLFAGQPRGVADWIRYRRLDRARTELAAAPHTTVAAVAARYCFSTPTIFARAFRDEFGCSPRDVRR